MKKPANYINHIALVLDASTSMRDVQSEVVKVADQQIAHLAQRSKDLDQETRVTVYTFNEGVECLFYDKDVLRLPSLRGLYIADGNTALIDASIKALEDLSKTPELYGDHAFLTYILTDGEENASRQKSYDLEGRLRQLKENWTVAAFVPNRRGVEAAQMFGFPRNNIAVWETTGAGFREVGRTIQQATDTYMDFRSKGIRGSRNLFTPDTTKLSPSTVRAKASGSMVKLGPGQFRLLPVVTPMAISDFVERQTGRRYVLGEAFYQLTSPVTVQAQKQIAIFDKANFAVYTGRDARLLLNLPDYEVKVSPHSHPAYDIFIQSTSVNRKLFAGTSVLLLS